MTTASTTKILELIGELDPIAALPLVRREEIVQLCTVTAITQDRAGFSLAEWPRQIVYLVNGEAKLRYADGSTQVLVGGGGSARFPLGSGNAPTELKPITDIQLLSLDEETLDLVLAWSQSGTADMDSMPGQTQVTDWRMMSGMFAAKNLANSAFASLPAANITRLLERFERVVVKRSEVVLREGDTGDYYYLVEQGRSLVTRQVGGVAMEIAALKPGDAFGEEALLADATRNATVTMQTDGALLRLSKGDFFELLREPLLTRLTWTESQQRIADGAQWIDVRFPAEFFQDGLPGALNVPLNEIRRSVTMLDTGREYVAYCQSGRRSSAAAFLLSQRGVRTSALVGGLNARS